jgi:hypothetical protein
MGNYGYLLLVPDIRNKKDKRKVYMCDTFRHQREKKSNILDLLFKPFPQSLAYLGVPSILASWANPSPRNEILRESEGRQCLFMNVIR